MRVMAVAAGNFSKLAVLYVLDSATGVLWSYPSFVAPFTVQHMLPGGMKYQAHLQGCTHPGYPLFNLIDPLPDNVTAQTSIVLRFTGRVSTDSHGETRSTPTIQLVFTSPDLVPHAPPPGLGALHLRAIGEQAGK